MTSARSARPLRISLVGTRGVPARYGGFETCVDEVGRRLVTLGHRVVVYCRPTEAKADDSAEEYLGMRRVRLPAIRGRSLETLSHTGLSVLHLVRHRPDVAIMFNAANAPYLPILRAARVPVATHVDGLEWKRAKWGPTGQRYYRTAESLAVRWSDALIADARGIADYYRHSFDATSYVIAYGAPIIQTAGDRLAELDLVSGGFHLVVARFEPENHLDVTVGGYRASRSRLPLVVVGSAPYADEYTRRIRDLGDERVQFVGGIWDQELLDELYSHCATYVHGHSVGGTNPSLLRAIGAGAPTAAFDVGFNREVLAETGVYFRTADELCQVMEAAEADLSRTAARGRAARERARAYDWDDVARAYEQLCRDLTDARVTTNRPSGRRIREWRDDPAPPPKPPAAAGGGGLT